MKNQISWLRQFRTYEPELAESDCQNDSPQSLCANDCVKRRHEECAGKCMQETST